MEKINAIKDLYEKNQRINKELKEIDKNREYFLKKQLELEAKLSHGKKQTSKFMGSRGHLEEMG
jgi:hypothetical protein